MSHPIFMATPPEVHSAMLSTGPGPGLLLAAAAAWNLLSIEYARAAAELAALLATVQVETWDGPTAEAYVAAHLLYLAWLLKISAHSATMAARQEALAVAYIIALAEMPTEAELVSNHAARVGLMATNFFGINAVLIALNEAAYRCMWWQAATVMETYQVTSATAVAATPHSSPAPEIVKTNALTAASDEPLPLPPDRQNQIQQWLQRIGYTDFYNNVMQPAINGVKNLPFFQAMFSGFDPWLPVLGNPLTFLSPYNIAFALGYPMDIGSYVALLSQTFAFIVADLAAAFASGNPATIGFTLVFVTVEAIGTIITDTIALLKTLLEQTLVLLPTVLPLLAGVVTPLVAIPVGAAAGLARLGWGGVTPSASPVMPPAPITPPPNFPPKSSPAPVPEPATISALTPHPPPATGVGAGTGMEDFAYLVGELNAVAKKTSRASVRKKTPESDGVSVPRTVDALQEPARPQRRKRTKVKEVGRGYEYLDLEPDSEQPVASVSDRGAKTLGFTGTVAKQPAAVAAGLATLAGERFGDGPRTPMMPGSWGADSVPSSPPGQ